jgi:hypothetical protein
LARLQQNSRQLFENKKQLKIKGNKLILTKTDRITHAYVQWLADVHFAVFAPAFPFVVSRQEIRPQTANAHSLSR